MKALAFIACFAMTATAHAASPGWNPSKTTAKQYLTAHPGAVITNQYNSQNQAIGGITMQNGVIVKVTIDPNTGAATPAP